MSRVRKDQHHRLWVGQGRQVQCGSRVPQMLRCKQGRDICCIARFWEYSGTASPLDASKKEPCPGPCNLEDPTPAFHWPCHSNREKRSMSQGNVSTQAHVPPPNTESQNSLPTGPQIQLHSLHGPFCWACLPENRPAAGVHTPRPRGWLRGSRCYACGWAWEGHTLPEGEPGMGAEVGSASACRTPVLDSKSPRILSANLVLRVLRRCICQCRRIQYILFRGCWLDL